MLSGILMVVIFAMGLITLTQERKPPIIDLTEDCLPEKDREEQRNCRQFGFLTGSYILSEPFLKALDREYNDKIKPIIQDYRMDVIEVIGHTDGQPNPGASNLDFQLQQLQKGGPLTGFRSGSNADLGLLRAMAVGMHLQNLLKEDQEELGDVEIRPYSAASLLNPETGNFNPAPAIDEQQRRRIELRFIRTSS